MFHYRVIFNNEFEEFTKEWTSFVAVFNGSEGFKIEVEIAELEKRQSSRGTTFLLTSQSFLGQIQSVIVVGNLKATQVGINFMSDLNPR